jgi:hypothetical protein
MTITHRFHEVLKDNDMIRPLTPKDVDVDYLRKRCQESGLNLNLSEKGRESLAKTEFVTFHEGRGPGVAEFIGRSRVVPLLELTYHLMNPRRKLKSGNEKSAARGMRQWVADFAQLVTDPELSDEKVALFCLRTNQRVKAGYSRGKHPDTFEDIPNPPKTLASVPPDSIPKLWQFLTTSQQKTNKKDF